METLQYPLMNEWVKKMWSIYKTKYYSALKYGGNTAICDNRNEARGLLSEKLDAEEQTLYDSLYKVSKTVNVEAEERGGFQGCWEGKGRAVALLVEGFRYDSEAGRVSVHGVAESWPRLSD